MLHKIIPTITVLLMGTLAAADSRRPSDSSVASYAARADISDAEQSADIALYSRLLAATRTYQAAPTLETEKAFQFTCNQLELYLTRKNVSGALAQWRRLFAQEMSPQKLKDIIQLAEIYLATSSDSDSDDDMHYGISPSGGPLPAIRPAGLPNLNLAGLSLRQDPSSTGELACVPPSGPLSCIAEVTERSASAKPTSCTGTPLATPREH